MTAEGTINYDALAQDAMRGVVRNVLAQTARTGLPGEHHFYISFDTLAPGVVLSKRLREKYPGEMTIVLQHRFWDLIVNDERFEVKLTFDGIPERLVIPYSAIKVFFDPSVRYGLQFEAADLMSDMTATARPAPRQSPSAPPTVLAPVAAFDNGSGTDAPDSEAHEHAADSASAETGSGDTPATDNDTEQEPEPAAGAEIVSLDSFRKK